MTSPEKTTKRADPGDVAAVIRRILAENGREYLWHYVFATACLIAIAASTGFVAWIIRPIVDELVLQTTV